jgi:general stress protein 26
MKSKKLFALLLILPIFYSIGICQEQQPKIIPPDTLLKVAREMIESQQFCGLMTVDSSGMPIARTVNPLLPESDWTIWIATSVQSRKVENIRRNPHVSLYYADHAHITGYVNVRGTAYLINDMAEKQKRKREYWEQMYPGLKDLILIKVVPEEIEVVNYPHGINNAPGTSKAPSVKLPRK